MANISLRIKVPDQPIREESVGPRGVYIGRASGNNIVINHPSISRRHARIYFEGDLWWIEDLGSSNGILVANERLPINHPHPVQAGDPFSLGEVVMVFREPSRRRRASRVTVVLGLAAGLVILALLCAVSIPLINQYIKEAEKASVATCDSPPMALVMRGGVPVPTGNFSATATSGLAGTSDFAQQTAAVQPTTGPGTPTLTPGPIQPTSPPSRPITSLAFLDLPFPYDGGNSNFGGTLGQFKNASQLSYLGGRVNSYFDHLLPLYPASKDPDVPGGSEPAEPPIGENILIFDGSLHGNVNYSGHPAYDYSTFVRRQPTTPLFAAADGSVHSVGTHGASGALFVKIRHAVPGVGDFLTIYWHLHPDEYFEAMLGTEGRAISAGTRIGTMGNTGYSTGHHLHFEVRFDRNQDGQFAASEVVDPYGFIPSTAYPNDPWMDRNAPVSNYLWVHPLGVVAEVSETGGGALDPTADTGGVGGTGIEASLCAPPNAFPPGGTVYWSWAPDPPPEPNRYGTQHGCVLSVFDENGEPVDHFIHPVTISIPYTEADLKNINPDSLFIHLLDPVTNQWAALPTQLDTEAMVATALTDRPGKCALMGEPLVDLIPPVTTIEFSGEATASGTWYGTVTVTLTSEDDGGIDRIDYSLDGGTTWRPYTGPFPITPNGIPEPIERMDEQFFGGGPGRFLILASAVDNAGNLEDPPAWRSLVIDPSQAPEAGLAATTPTETPSATPSLTPTATVTLTPSGEAFVCAETVTLLENANCRGGPGTVYDVVTSFTGETVLSLAGQNISNDIKWWFVEIPDSISHCWISDSLVELVGNVRPSCVQVLQDPPTPTPSTRPTPSITPSPTPTSLTPPPPADNSPPPAPGSLTPTDGVSQPCSGTVTHTWGSVSDQSGINYYEWTLERSTNGWDGPWSPVASGQTGGTSVSPGVSCGLWYRWRVRAVDNAENVGDYSTWAFYTVVIN